MSSDPTKQLTVRDVVYSLVGQIRPIGDSHVDGWRFNNLKEMTTLLDELLTDVREVADMKDHHAYSVSRAGKYAQEFLDGFQEVRHPATVSGTRTGVSECGRVGGTGYQERTVT